MFFLSSRALGLFAVEGASTAVSGQVDSAFVSSGFDNWKKALEKGRGFQKHNESRVTYLLKMLAARSFSRNRLMCSSRRERPSHSETPATCSTQLTHYVLARIFDVVRFLARLSLPFRGHDESQSSHGRGVFLKFVHYLANRPR